MLENKFQTGWCEVAMGLDSGSEEFWIIYKAITMEVNFFNYCFKLLIWNLNSLTFNSFLKFLGIYQASFGLVYVLELMF
jgi:hypothetical protein